MIYAYFQAQNIESQALALSLGGFCTPCIWKWCEGNDSAWLKVAVHASALGSEAALAAAPGPDLVSSLPGNKGAPLPTPLPNHSMWNEMEEKDCEGEKV